MTITSETSSTRVTADGIVTVVNYDIDMSDDADMMVYFEATLIASNDSVYSWVDDRVAKTITFQTPPPDQTLITMQRYVAATQITDYRPYDAFPAETHEAALDKLTMLVQQADSLSSRALHYPINETNASELPTAATRADKFLSFDANGDILMSSGTSTDPTTVQQSGNVAPGNLSLWAGQQLLGDSGLVASEVYTDSRPPPDTATGKMDLVASPTDNNAVVMDSAGNAKDAGFGLLGAEFNQVTVSNWGRGGHTAQAHGLGGRPSFIMIEAILLDTSGGWQVGDALVIDPQGFEDSGQRSALAIQLMAANFIITHSSGLNSNYLMLPRSLGTSDAVRVTDANVDLRISFYRIG